MYLVLTAYTSGCVALASRCSAGPSNAYVCSRALRAFPEPSPVSAARDRRKPSVSSPSGHPALIPRDLGAWGSHHAIGDRSRKAAIGNSRRAHTRRVGPPAMITAAPLPHLYRTGRRLMRQTPVPNSHAATAPGRCDMFAPLPATRSGSASRLGLPFGLPLTPESGGPSRYPAVRPAPADRRALRRQEFSDAQQDVDRCHPSGRNPGRGGPRQSSRRV